MNSETKICQSCKIEFTIEPDDFAFYEKVKVPPPTWCPECRLERRLCFMNERSLYKRSCSMCGNDMISMFRPDAENPVYCTKCWWSDKWDAMDYAMDMDFSRPFLEQFLELRKKVPEMGRQVMETTMQNSDYCNISSYLKNCYLLFNSDYNEDSAYSTCLERSKSCYDITMSDMCELCYESRNLFKCYRTFYSENCNECTDVAFSRNLVGCSDCFGCANLRGKRYYIFNTPYTKEEYEREISKYHLGSWNIISELRTKVDFVSRSYPRKFYEGIQNLNVSGDYIFNSKNTHGSFESVDCENSKFCAFLFIKSTKDSYDYTCWGGGAERMYECMGAGGGQNDVKFTFYTWCHAMNMEYCWSIMVGNSDIFGCVSPKNKKFCILNKQYSEEEYHALRKLIIQHMNDMPYIDSKGRSYKYGEFFPPEFSLFGYNEAWAQMYFPITKDTAVEKGYVWRDSEKKSYNASVLSDALPDDIAGVGDEILNEVIECEHKGVCEDQCSGAFRIIPKELEFYRRMSVPLPRLCSNCRNRRRINGKNPMKLWKGRCACGGTHSKNEKYQNGASHFHGENVCPNEFETSYSPDREEIIYCEQCYQVEVI